MNVTVENLAACKKLLRVEVEAEKVDEALQKATREFQKEAVFPGFRPGKAPREMVARKYHKDIEEEARHRLVAKAYADALQEQNLDVVGYPDLEIIEFAAGKPMQFAATIETAPEFELPEYKGIPIRREAKQVTEEDVARAIDLLRERGATYEKVDRPAETGEVVVVNFTGTSDGRPITELAPTATGIGEQRGFWIQIGTASFIPGFDEQLIGARAGDKRVVQLIFPADFINPELAGKPGRYEVEVVEVKQKVLPVLDDEFAKKYGAESVEKLREGVRTDLGNELAHQQSSEARNQIVRSLLNRVSFDLPESAVARATRHVVYDIVRDNAQRGVSREAIEKEKEQIYSAAAQGGKERVKLTFLLEKIAKQEHIDATGEEVTARIIRLAAAYQISPEKLVKDLQKRNGVNEIYEQVRSEKTLAYLEKNARIEEFAPGSEPPPSA